MAQAPTEPVAAVDCGTNSTRLLIRSPGRPDVRLMRITRLGRGVDATGKLDPDAVERTLAVLAEYRGVIDRHGARRIRLVATSAVRDAANGEEFLADASAVVGARAELLTGTEEGRLAFLGASAELALPGHPPLTVIDIGGGSTELAVGPGTGEAVSLPLGCVRLTERFFHHDPPLPSELEAAGHLVDAELARAASALPALETPGRTLVGLAGTVSTLAALEQGLDHYDRERLHHFALPAATVARWAGVLAAEPARSRLARPGMEAGREDVIVGGVLVLRRAMVRFAHPACTVSESDILDGLAASLSTS
jgi:exopolyphosphatase/guanosine-5'-triphosphate,3'-diphosphate pyrophosphatase